VFETVTWQQAGGSRRLNHFSFGDGFFIQRQVERRGDRLFMRAKKRLA